MGYELLIFDEQQYHSPVHENMTRADTASIRLCIDSNKNTIESNFLYLHLSSKYVLQDGLWAIDIWWTTISQLHNLPCGKILFAVKLLSRLLSIIFHWTWICDCWFTDHWLVFFARKIILQIQPTWNLIVLYDSFLRVVFL